MRTLHYSNGTTKDICETLSEVLSQAIEWMTEDDTYYFARVSSDDHNGSIYKVEKATGKATLIEYVNYFADGYEDNARPVDPMAIKNKAS